MRLKTLKDIKALTKRRKRFTDDALVPYTRKNGVYALPLTQVYLVMFVRTDILNELKISVPQTWNELLDSTAMLQRNNMTVGLPYTAVTASGRGGFRTWRKGSVPHAFNAVRRQLLQ